MNMMKHLLVVLSLALGMTTWLYSYKPRHYATGKLIVVFVANLCLWLVIFGVLYTVVFCVVKLMKRYLFK